MANEWVPGDPLYRLGGAYPPEGDSWENEDEYNYSVGCSQPMIMIKDSESDEVWDELQVMYDSSAYWQSVEWERRNALQEFKVDPMPSDIASKPFAWL